MAGAGLSCFFLLAALCLAGVSGQLPTCESFAGSPSYCANSVTYPVFLPPGVTQEYLATSLLNELPEALLGFIPTDCRPYTILVRFSWKSFAPLEETNCEQIACARAFRSCNGTDPLVPPLPMCTSSCTTFNEVLRNWSASLTVL
jgi:hypothetical protein